MIYISAGHHLKDPGAVGNGYQEYKLCIELRDMVIAELQKSHADYIADKDYETLSAYLNRIQPGSGSVLCELHFNSASSEATGVEVIYPTRAYGHTNHVEASKELAQTLSAEIAEALGIKNRGVKTEADTARKRLAVLQTKAGISILPEICFLSNVVDMERYQRNKDKVAKVIAQYLIYYEKLKS